MGVRMDGMAIKLLKPNVDYAVDNKTESVCSFLI